MFYKLKDCMRRNHFARQVQSLLNTPAIRLGEASAPIVLSQLQHKDLLMYLAAIKSFARQLPPSAVHVVDDGSLTAQDYGLLGQHVPGIRFHALADCRVAGLPRGNTWERLIAIARLSRMHYVIQLDADTLTRGAITEVAQLAQTNCAFTMGTWDGQKIESASERAAIARIHNPRGTHVQMQAEMHLDRLSGVPSLKYVRGCSGFAGFPAGSDQLQLIYHVSTKMQKLIGDKWLEWGSEQVMSNLIVANEPDAMVLPYPEYTDCEEMQPHSRFVHFIGTCRFQGGRYADMINKLDWNPSS